MDIQLSQTQRDLLISASNNLNDLKKVSMQIQNDVAKAQRHVDDILSLISDAHGIEVPENCTIDGDKLIISDK